MPGLLDLFKAGFGLGEKAIAAILPQSGGLVEKITGAAAASGVTMPMDNDLKGVALRSKELKADDLTLAELDRRVVAGLLALRTPKGDAAAKTLTAQIKTARGGIATALRSLTSAESNGSEAQRALLSGRPDAKKTANFYALKEIGYRLHTVNHDQAQRVINTAKSLSTSSAVLGVTGTAKGIASIGYQTAREAVTGGVKQAQAVGESLIATAPILKYAPYIALALGALWAGNMALNITGSRRRE